MLKQFHFPSTLLAGNIFTAADDNTVGQTIYYSTGYPQGNYYANPAIYASGSRVAGELNAFTDPNLDYFAAKAIYE